MQQVSVYRASTDSSANTIPEGTPRMPSISSADPDEEEDFTAEDEDPAAYPFGVKAELFDLLLPSSSVCIAKDFSSPAIREKELQLRIGCLEGGLCEVRLLLRIRTSVGLNKKANIVGQKANTRAGTLISNYNKKIENVRLQYEHDRSAALRLDPASSWKERLQPLKKTDVRPPHQNEDEVEGTVDRADRRVWRESSRNISWIWKVNARPTSEVQVEEDDGGEGEFFYLHHGVSLSNPILALRVEWAKAYARVNRFAEEVELLIEEMRRGRRYLTWKSGWWREHLNTGSSSVGSLVKAGRAAYALKQASILDALSQKFVAVWTRELAMMKFDPKIIDV